MRQPCVERERAEEVNSGYAGLYDLVQGNEKTEDVFYRPDELDDFIFNDTEYEVSGK